MATYSRLSRKQAGVIYRNVKAGALVMTREQIGSMYDLADGRIIWNDRLAEYDDELVAAVDAVFSGNLSVAQEHIDRAVLVHARVYGEAA